MDYMSGRGNDCVFFVVDPLDPPRKDHGEMIVFFFVVDRFSKMAILVAFPMSIISQPKKNITPRKSPTPNDQSDQDIL
jgi:hypothetical protein